MTPVTRQVFIIVIALGVIVVAGTTIIRLYQRYQHSKQPQATTVTFSPSPSQIPTPYGDWTLFQNQSLGYIVGIPADWSLIKNEHGKTVFTPSENTAPLGSFQEISITMLEDGVSDIDLTTKTEFETWFNRKLEESSDSERLYKLGNETVSNQPAISFLDVGEQDNPVEGWSVVTWVRYQEKNYYLTAEGDGELTENDIAIYQYFLSSFSFIAS